MFREAQHIQPGFMSQGYILVPLINGVLELIADMVVTVIGPKQNTLLPNVHPTVRLQPG